jgi:hypothetical protein
MEQRRRRAGNRGKDLLVYDLRLLAGEDGQGEVSGLGCALGRIHFKGVAYPDHNY